MLRFPKIVIGAAAGAALFMLGIMSGHAQAGPQSDATPSAETARQLELLGKVLDMVRSNYVDKPDDGKLLTSAINGVLGGLDPHSSYMDAKSYRDMQVTTSGQFGGLGMQVNMEDGLLKVVSPIDDTPAAKAGILAGDVITQVDGTPIKGLTLNQAVEKMRGAPGTEVRLEIVRKDQAAPLNLTLTRQIIKVSTVRQRDEGGDVGYVRHHPVQQPGGGRAQAGGRSPVRRKFRRTSSRATSRPAQQSGRPARSGGAGGRARF